MFLFKKMRKIESDLSIILHSQLTSQFIVELKNGFSKKNSIERSNVIFLDDKKLIFGDEKIGESQGFVFNILSSFSYNNIYNKKKFLKITFFILLRKL